MSFRVGFVGLASATVRILWIFTLGVNTFFIFFNVNTMTYRNSLFLALLQEVTNLYSMVFWIDGANDTVIHATFT